MAKRIYTYYGIKIIDENGENFIKLNGNVNTSSYSEMKKSYHKAKMKNKDRNCKVQLIGLFSNGDEGAIIYEKEFIKETMIENKELLTPVNDIVAEIKYNLDLIQRKREYHYSSSGAKRLLQANFKKGSRAVRSRGQEAQGGR